MVSSMKPKKVTGLLGVMSVLVGLGHLHSFLPLSQMLVSLSPASATEYLLPAHPALHWLLTVLSGEPGLLTLCGALGTLLSFLCRHPLLLPKA